ncbi:uncharacterized protein MYCGRDRAFT_105321 [Zymoseptoria tritici IPO323]|uniref:Uncharacterized protein n=1 Tax=Zymoseptoria tritici (strain CBS 115943 / IPO323) TaxID=336722 RepID=F9XHS8_ZYMTI|nr:uncharacterized protein MYCGRDRAFT_105321 [Zymoseptoria tritici IPO323]EGP85524.1 hypothetical protein MYCGRDRAFT_105321 [Zymoseptoria tritici IPO323]
MMSSLPLLDASPTRPGGCPTFRGYQRLDVHQSAISPLAEFEPAVALPTDHARKAVKVQSGIRLVMFGLA